SAPPAGLSAVLASPQMVVGGVVTGHGGTVVEVSSSNSPVDEGLTASALPANRNVPVTRDNVATAVIRRRPRRFLYTVRLNTIGTPQFRFPNRSFAELLLPGYRCVRASRPSAPDEPTTSDGALTSLTPP